MSDDIEDDPYWMTGLDLERYENAERSLIEFGQLFQEQSDDHAMVIVGAAFLDTRLEYMAMTFLVDDPKEVGKLMRYDQPLGTYGNRITMLYCLGLIGKTVRDDLRLIGKIRNHFAHMFEANFEEAKVQSWCAALKWHRTHYVPAPEGVDARDHFYVAISQLVGYLSGLTSIARGARRKLFREPQGGLYGNSSGEATMEG